MDIEPSSPGPAFAIRGPISRDDLPGLCDRVCEVLSVAPGRAVSCDVSTVGAAAVTIEALALLQLAARRKSCRIQLRNASPDLLGLVAFLGLQDVLPEEPAASEEHPGPGGTVSRPAAGAD